MTFIWCEFLLLEATALESGGVQGQRQKFGEVLFVADVKSFYSQIQFQDCLHMYGSCCWLLFVNLNKLTISVIAVNYY